jgi:sugar lactone lactonase YvrE
MEPYVEDAGHVSSPVIDPKSGVLLYTNVSNGDILSCEGKGEKPMKWANSGGSPSGIALDSQGNL